MEKELSLRGWELILRRGDSFEQLASICEETKADAVFFCERYDMFGWGCMFAERLRSCVSEVRSFPSNLLFNPKDLLNQKSEPYKIFTSFWKRTRREYVKEPLPIPLIIHSYDRTIPSLQANELGLLPENTWYEKFHKYWEPGERGAITKWMHFMDEGLSRYDEERDIPSANSVSSLSPHLVWGDISVKSIWHAAKRLMEEGDEGYRQSSIDAFLRQLVWREFAYHQLIHFPTILSIPLREKFTRFIWQGSDEQLSKWQTGFTGYPLVDAGMRELWETGIIHNRVRMIAASFLVKHLLISWVDGSKWFQKTLIDFDPANNAMGWQWVAGTGIDASPYFRVFNPTLQSQKIDSDGLYIRKWTPELAQLPVIYIHEPWKAPEHILTEAKIVLGETYPLPIIDHSIARMRVLEAYGQVKNS